MQLEGFDGELARSVLASGQQYRAIVARPKGLGKLTGAKLRSSRSSHVVRGIHVPSSQRSSHPPVEREVDGIAPQPKCGPPCLPPWSSLQHSFSAIHRLSQAARSDASASFLARALTCRVAASASSLNHPSKPAVLGRVGRVMCTLVRLSVPMTQQDHRLSLMALSTVALPCHI